MTPYITKDERHEPRTHQPHAANPLEGTLLLRKSISPGRAFAFAALRRFSGTEKIHLKTRRWIFNLRKGKLQYRRQEQSSS